MQRALFICGELALVFVGVILVLNHPGFASKLMPFIFVTFTLGTILDVKN